jgi:hypothetical protein
LTHARRFFILLVFEQLSEEIEREICENASVALLHHLLVKALLKGC